MRHRVNQWLESLSDKATKAVGSGSAFGMALFVVLAWALTGPIFAFSDTWQLVINTGTTIVTFLMVFLIQRTQNKETEAMQLKLNELVAALKGASNKLIDLEDWTEEQLHELHRHYERLADLAQRDGDSRRSLSVDDADARHDEKKSGEKPAA